MKRTLTILDWLVIFAVLFAFSLPCLILFWDAHVVAERLKQHFILIDTAAILSCVLLFAWMIFNGKQSVLWNWFPPFCLFPKVEWVKWLVVSAIIVGTIMGIICQP